MVLPPQGLAPGLTGARITRMTSSPPLAWTVRLCRGLPGAAEAAGVAASQGATVRWCGPDCGCGAGDEDDGEAGPDG